jgi:hypothetical protein
MLSGLHGREFQIFQSLKNEEEKGTIESEF